MPRLDAQTQLSLLTGNELWVDKNADATISERGQYERPFATIQAAIDAAQAGDVVIIRPGVYTEQIVCKDGVSVRGVDRRQCALSYTGASTVTVITMAESMLVTDLDLRLNPTAGTTTGVKFAGTSNTTASVFRVNINAALSGNVVGCEDAGTGTTPNVSALMLSVMRGSGTGYGVYKTGAGTSVYRLSDVDGPTGAKIAAGTAHLHNADIQGTTTALRVDVGATVHISAHVSVSSFDIQGTIVQESFSYPRDTLDSAVNPALTDDSVKGYSTGSRWLNVTSGTLFTCLDAAVGAAFWSFIQTNDSPAGTLTPGEHFLGSLLDYGGSGGATAGEVQYTKTFLTGGTVITNMRCYVDTGGSAARNIRMGIYTQTDPTSLSGEPVTRVAQTAAEGTAGADGLFFTKALTSSYSVPTTGYYWIAFVTDNAAALKISLSPTVYRAGFLPVRRESSAGTTLPATVGTITNPSSAIVYAAAVE